MFGYVQNPEDDISNVDDVSDDSGFDSDEELHLSASDSDLTDLDRDGSFLTPNLGPCRCDKCGRMFTRRTNLITHMRVRRSIVHTFHASV